MSGPSLQLSCPLRPGHCHAVDSAGVVPLETTTYHVADFGKPKSRISRFVRTFGEYGCLAQLVANGLWKLCLRLGHRVACEGETKCSMLGLEKDLSIALFDLIRTEPARRPRDEALRPRSFIFEICYILVLHIHEL